MEFTRNRASRAPSRLKDRIMLTEEEAMMMIAGERGPGLFRSRLCDKANDEGHLLIARYNHEQQTREETTKTKKDIIIRQPSRRKGESLVQILQ